MLLRKQRKAGARVVRMSDDLITPARISAASPDNLLEPGERLIWWGQPKAFSYAIQRTFFNLVFVAAVLLFSADLSARFSDQFLARTAIYMVVAIASLVVLYALITSPTVFYAITDRRAIIIRRDVRKDMELKKISSISSKQHVLGINSLTFIEEQSRNSDYESGYAPQRDGFYSVGDIKAVEAKLQQAINAAGAQ
jgi:hypothetical protein